MQRVVSDGDSSDEDSDIPLNSVKKRKNHVSFCDHNKHFALKASCNSPWYFYLQKIISDDESSYDSSLSNEGARNNFGVYMTCKIIS